MVKSSAVSDTTLTTGVLGSGGYWKVATVHESNRANGGDNTLTFTLQPSVPIASGQKITIDGLTGSQTLDVGTDGSCTPGVFSVTNMAAIGTSGVWTQATGTLVLTLTTGLVETTTYSPKIVLKNPATANAGVWPKVKSTSPVLMTTATLTPVLAGTHSWSTFSVSEASTATGANNAVTINIKPAVELPKGQQLVVSGLSGTQTTDMNTCSALMSVTGTDSAKFGNTAHWTQAGTLTLTAADKIVSSADTSITITLKNSATAVAGKFASLASTSSTGLASSGHSASTAVLGAGGGYWTALTVSESSQAAGADNKITFKFTPSVTLKAATKVTIGGLTGTSTTPSDTLSGWSITSFSAGNLILTVGSSDLTSAQELAVTLKNPAAGSGQVPVIPSIESQADTKMSKQWFGGVPVLGGTSTWTTAAVAESSWVNGGLNTITFTVQPSTALGAGRVVTIKNLMGSTTPDNAKLAVGGTAGPVFGSTADWKMATGVLTLTVATSLPASASVFSVVLLNPAKAQVAKTPSIGAAAPHLVTELAMISTSSAAILGGSGTWAAQVMESSTVTAADNKLTFTITPSPALKAGQIITITGLVNSQTADNTALAVTKADDTPATAFQNSAGTAGAAGWTKNTGTLVLVAKTDIASTGEIFRITLKNPATAMGSAVASIYTAKPQVLAGAGVVGTVLGCGGGYFSAKSVKESNTINRGMNTLTFSFKPSVKLAKGSKVIIKGLKDTQTPDNTKMPVIGTNAAAFENSTAAWVKSTGDLTLVVGADIASSSTTEFAVVVQNTKTGQAAVMPTIQVDSTVNPIKVAYFSEKVLGGMLMWSTATVCETTIATGATTHLQISIRPSATLGAGQVVTIAGLTGSTTADNTVMGISGTGAPAFGDTGNWAMATGTLTLTVASSLVSTADTKITLSLGNKAAAQAAVIPWIASNGGAGAGQMVVRAWFNSGVLGAGGGYWLARAIGESSSTNKGANTITVTMKPSVDIAATGKVLIEGLTGSMTADNAALGVGGAGSALFGSKGAWLGTAGTLTLTVADSQTIPSKTDTVITFVLTNSLIGQTAKSAMISGVAVGKTLPVAAQMLSGMVLGGTTMWKKAGMKDTVHKPSVLNQIHFMIEPAVKIHGGAKITISGLAPSQTSDKADLDVQGPMAAVFGMSGAWTQNSGQLILTVLPGHEVANDKVTSFFITLMNPAAAQAGVTGSVQSFGQRIVPMTFMGTVLSAGGGWFVKRSVKEDNLANGADNMVTFALTPSVPMPEGRTITISMLTNAQDATSTKEIGGPFAKHFNGTGAYTSSDKKLVLTIMSNYTLKGNMSFSFTVKLKNPASAKPGVKPTVSGTLMTAQEINMRILSGTAKMNATVVEKVATPPFHKPTKLIFTLVPEVEIQAGTKVGLGGFKSPTPSNKVLPLGNNQASAFGNTADWNSKDGKLTLFVATTLPAKTEAIFEITLNQLGFGTPGVSPRLMIHGFETVNILTPSGHKILMAGGPTTTTPKPKPTATPIPTQPMGTPCPRPGNNTNGTVAPCGTPPPRLACPKDATKMMGTTPSSVPFNATREVRIKGTMGIKQCTKVELVGANDKKAYVFDALTSSGTDMPAADQVWFNFHTTVAQHYDVVLANCQQMGVTFKVPCTGSKVIVSTPSKQIRMKYNVDVNQITSNQAYKQQFETDFANGVSKALGVPADAVCCIKLQTGSMVVLFQLLEAEKTDGSGTVTPAALEAEVKTKATDIAKKIQQESSQSNYPGAGVAPAEVSVASATGGGFDPIPGYVQPPAVTKAPQATAAPATNAPPAVTSAASSGPAPLALLVSLVLLACAKLLM
jgi:hypothetical protein